MASSGEKPKLTFEKAEAICRRLLPIGANIHAMMVELSDAGFNAFLPRKDFVESFAPDPEALKIHRHCIVELSKERLARPLAVRTSIDQSKLVWTSDLIRKLKLERDEFNGVSVDQLSSRYGRDAVWRCEFDPCERARTELMVKDRPNYEIKWSEALKLQNRILRKEASHFVMQSNNSGPKFDLEARYDVFSRVMERESVKLGFMLDRKKSRPNRPVFSKSITSDWALCWGLEEARAFCHNDFEGRFDAYFGLRSRNSNGSLARVELGEFLRLKHALIVPGFLGGYWEFFDAESLEVVIMAHLFHYSLVAPVLEGALKAVLD
jgi:hypothetical protein